MSSYNVTMDYSAYCLGMNAINELLADRINQAVGAAAQEVFDSWADRVKKAPGIRPDERETYIKSLKWDYTGAYSARVWTDYDVADAIENGRPAYDMKRMLQTSSKTRQGKKGKYLIIPMRHNTPGHDAHARDMPANIYAAAGKMTKSRVIGLGTRLSATGATVSQAIYQWGNRLPPGMAPKLKPNHTTDIYAGMVRFDTSSGKLKSSAYLTFRIMGDWQAGKWIIPAKPGLYIAKQVAQDVQDGLEKTLNEFITAP